jgi:hypothetical protein
MDEYESVAAVYESRCKLLNLDTLCRRRILSVMFVRDVLCAKIDSSNLKGMLALTRQMFFNGTPLFH